MREVQEHSVLVLAVVIVGLVALAMPGAQLLPVMAVAVAVAVLRMQPLSAVLVEPQFVAAAAAAAALTVLALPLVGLPLGEVTEVLAATALQPQLLEQFPVVAVVAMKMVLAQMAVKEPSV